MENLVVPQFLDVEDKIIGPITVRQFIMMIAAGLLIFLEFRFFDFALFLFSAILTFGSLLLLAFIKVNGRPSYYFVLHMIETFKRPRLRVWKRMPHKTAAVDATPLVIKVDKSSVKAQDKQRPNMGDLKQLSLLVDTGGLYGVEGENSAYGKD